MELPVSTLHLTDCQIPPAAGDAREVSHHAPTQMNPIPKLQGACRAWQLRQVSFAADAAAAAVETPIQSGQLQIMVRVNVTYEIE